MTIGFIEHLIYLLLSVIIVYIIGFFTYATISSSQNKPTYLTVFYQYFSGTFAIITAYSIFKTHGFTINIVLLFFILFYFIKNKIKFNIKKAFFLEGIIISILFVIFWYAYMYFSHYDWVTHQIYNFDLDGPIYSSIAERLNHNGTESNISNTFYNEPIRNLYHFGDIWLIAFFSKILNITTYLASWLIFMPQQLMLFSIGVICISLNILNNKHKLFIIIISIPILFLPNLFSSISAQYIDQTSWSWVFGYTLMDSNKFMVVANCFIIVILQILNSQNRNAVLACCLCIVIHFGTLPAIALCLFIYYLLMLILKKHTIRETISFMLPFIFTIIFIITYKIIIQIINNRHLYYIPKSTTSFSIGIRSSHFYVDIIYTAINWIKSEFLRLIIFLFLGVLILIKNYKKSNYINVFIFSMCMILSGTLLASVLYFYPDAFQLLTLVYIPIALLFSLVTIIYLILYYKNVALFCVSLILINCVIQNYNVRAESYSKKEAININFRKQVVDELKANDSYSFASFIKTDTSKDDVWFANNNFYFPLSYISIYVDKYTPYCLTGFENYQESNTAIRDYQKEILFHSVFYKFVYLQIRNKQFKTLGKSQEDFIKEAKIKYLIIDKGAIVPPNVLSLIKHSYTDSLNNISFCILK